MTNALKRALKIRDGLQALELRTVESDPAVPIQLDGKHYKLEYRHKSTVAVFKATGINIETVSSISPQHIANPDVLEALLRAGLMRNHPALAQSDDLMDMIPLRHIGYVRACINLALQAAEPSPEDIERIMEEAGSAPEEPESPLATAPTSADSGHVVSIEESTLKM